jgi:tetratricopeptide (TPR) repeat protein
MKNTNFDESRNNFLREAEELLRLSNLSEALNLAEERLRKFPADADALGVCCEALIGMGRIDDLRELLNEVAGIIAGLNLIYERAGDACRENGYHHEAAVCYEKFISLRPEAEKAGEIIGKMAFLEQEDSPGPPAQVDFTDNVNASKQNFFTVTMAQLYIEQGHLQDAEIILEEIINKEPHNTQALAMLDELRGSQLSQSESEGEAKSFKSDNLIAILSSWLKNIERLKINAAEKSRG